MEHQINFATQTQANVCDIKLTCPTLNFDQIAETKTRSFVDGTLHKRIAALVNLPEYANVVYLQQKRLEAQAEIDRIEAKIQQAKDACVCEPVADAATVEQSTVCIQECEQALAASRLAVESVDRVLGEATATRNLAVKQSITEIMRQEVDRLQSEVEAATQKIWQECGSLFLDIITKRRSLALIGSFADAGIETIQRLASESK